MGDLLYAFTEWLRTTQLTEFSLWLSNTWLSLTIQENFWAIPTIQTIHMLAIAATFGAVMMINLRIFGIAGAAPMDQTILRYRPWIWWGLVVLVITGLGMIIGEPVRELINPVFWVKVVLLIVMILVTLWFQSRMRRTIASSPEGQGHSVGIRAGAVTLTILWIAIMFAGRWIAYAPT